ncbi:DNA mismatch repair endonuclease MutL [Kosmotoga pacifica]|uniref:DNA mismatch repair protein MutL n=1 Tax=Kosmotoga pacifica TaxID=1330330 RepID=A0A0G2Z616_9BACT|nr:DNA mismatch repair endonuclease MutL [Kosmotoga pacifica]AKI96982.1 DNA mismatch repair protein MutL [Kosmotoga pacifica]
MKIRELPKEVVLKIAAGEVVTGCFSVVKELIENSIDAHTRRIEVEIREGGKEFIRVSDDGEGMSPEDLKEAIKPHTTSKIKSIEDLYRLNTYGFRGEALSTIASVSRMIITSKQEKNSVGLSLRITGGNVVAEEPYLGKTGTMVEVYDLLFNTPARRKFLKSAAVEGRMVTEIVQRFMLSNPSISFLYVKDGKVIYDSPIDQPLKDRIRLIFPELKPDDLIEVEYTDENSGISVRGFVTMPERTRLNRFGEMIFVNSRHVKQIELNYALERGYGETLEKGRFPFAIIFIEVDPALVDVNVHPQKLEVKFSRTSLVLDALKRAVRVAIHQRGTFRIKPGISSESIQKANTEIEKNSDYDFKNREHIGEHWPKIRESYRSVPDESYALPLEIERKNFRAFQPENSRKESKEFKFIGVFGERYILVEGSEGLIIIDQHAAHERLIFERLKRNKRIESQQLISPITLKIDALRSGLLDNNQKKLMELGFRWKSNGDKITLEAIPSLVPQNEAEKVFLDILDELRLVRLEDPVKVFDNLLASIACKAAIKTGDRLNEVEARNLLEELIEEKLVVCPHGRPISMFITLNDLDRFFSRR